MILAQNWPKTAKSWWHCSFNTEEVFGLMMRCQPSVDQGSIKNVDWHFTAEAFSTRDPKILPSNNKFKINHAALRMRRVLETCLVICFKQVTQPLVSKQASPVTLPHIGSSAGRVKSTMSMEKYPVIIHEPTAIRTARHVSVKPQGGSYINRTGELTAPFMGKEINFARIYFTINRFFFSFSSMKGCTFS